MTCTWDVLVSGVTMSLRDLPAVLLLQLMHAILFLVPYSNDKQDVCQPKLGRSGASQSLPDGLLWCLVC